MRTITISIIGMLALVAAAGAQNAVTARSVREDMMAALTGDMVRFERGMRTLEEVLSKNPKDPEVKVLHGNGVMARAGEAFKTGDLANASRLWQEGLDEMAPSRGRRPDNIFVRLAGACS